MEAGKMLLLQSSIIWKVHVECRRTLPAVNKFCLQVKIRSASIALIFINRAPASAERIYGGKNVDFGRIFTVV